MTGQAVAWDAVKLLAQMLGALLIARLAVNWALSRFKREKLWERQVAAIADIVSALSEMRLLNGIWLTQIEHGRSSSDEAQREHSARYAAASRRLQEATSMGSLLLPPAVNECLAKLERDREALEPTDEYEAYSFPYSLIDDAICSLVQDGRKLLS